MKLFFFGYSVLILLTTGCRGEDSLQASRATDQQMTIDEVLASAMGDINREASGDLNSETEVRELDMMFKPAKRQAAQAENERLSTEPGKRFRRGHIFRHKRTTIRKWAYHTVWTNKVVPYQIDPGVFNSSEQNEIQSAMDEWQNHTCIRFTNWSSETNYINFTGGPDCSSEIGMRRFESQRINLTSSCRKKRIILHEIGHALGFIHEHSRPDRDQYVRIHEENINEGAYDQFRSIGSKHIDTFGVPYDYDSIMHYGGMFESKNGQLTIETTKDRTAQERIGRSTRLSFRNIKLANLLYTCNDGCDPSITCPGEGFVGQDCNCYCPGDPIQLCRAGASAKASGHSIVTRDTSRLLQTLLSRK